MIAIVVIGVIETVLILGLISVILLADADTRNIASDWQAAFATTIGALGLILASLLNAQLAWRRDMRLRKHDAGDVANFLLAELRALKRILKFQSGLLKRAAARASEQIVPDLHVNSLLQMSAIPAADVFEGDKLKIGLLGDVLASDIKFFSLMVKTDQVSYGGILAAQGPEVAATFLSESRSRHAKMINTICERLESYLRGTAIPAYPRLWDINFFEAAPAPDEA